MPGIFVTGSGTGVGKTVIAAGIAWYLRSKKVDVGVMNPFATAPKRFSRNYASEDAALLSAAACVSAWEAMINPYFFPPPASPHVAALLLKRKPPDIGIAMKAARKLHSQHD